MSQSTSPERLDAEMRKDYEAMREIVAIADELRAKLAACESVTEEMISVGCEAAQNAMGFSFEELGDERIRRACISHILGEVLASRAAGEGS